MAYYNMIALLVCVLAVNGKIAKDDAVQRLSDVVNVQDVDTVQDIDDVQEDGAIEDAHYKVKGYEYLKKYGYLSKPPTKDSTSFGDGLETQAIKAIKRLQKFAGLAETGQIDSDTRELIEKPRCGVQDPAIITEEADGENTSESGGRSRRYVVAGPPYHWNKNYLTYKIVNYPGPPSTITREEVDADVRRAFKLWSDVTPLTFRSVDNEDEADIRFVFGRMAHTDVKDDPPFDGTGGAIAHAFSPNSNWGATDGDAHFDEDETYTHDGQTGVHFFNTAAHEIGHTLGLDHSDVPNALMWPWGSYYFTGLTLPQDDTDAIQSIYGANPNPPIVPPTKPSPPVHCVVSFSSLVMIREQIYAFSNDKLWRFDTNGNLLSEPEGELSRIYFPNLPRDVAAGYERWFDGKIHFFKGRNYWVYKLARASPPRFRMYNVDRTNLPSKPDYPRSVSELHLPKKISAALHVADEGRTYLFKAKKTFIVDEFVGNVTGATKTHLAFPGGQWFPTGAFYNEGYAYLTYSHGQGADYYRFKWDHTRKTFASLPGYPRNLYKELLHCPE